MSGRTSSRTSSGPLFAMTAEAWSWVGMTPRYVFATKPDKALGDPALSAQAEQLIQQALDKAGVKYRVKDKDGTFYAPKIDIQVKDALGREWQTATIQVDRLMLPERFDLHYIDENGDASGRGDPPRHPGLARALHRGDHRALRRGVSLLAGARPGGDRAYRRSPHRWRAGAGRRPRAPRPARRGR